MTATLSPPTEFLTTEEVMSRVGCGKSTLYDWMHAGQFPKPIRLAGRRLVRWDRHVIEQWLREQAATAGQ